MTLACIRRLVLGAGLLLAAPLLAGQPQPDATLRLPYPEAFPESVTIAGDDLVFSALGGNRLIRVDADGQPRRWLTVPGQGAAIYGVLADAPRNTLWACIVRRRGDAFETSLNRYVLDTGAFLQSALFPGTGRCNDMVVAPDGHVYATDIEAGRLFVFSPATQALTLLLDGPELKGIDGIAWLDGALYANNVRTGALWRVVREGDAARLIPQRLSRPLGKPDGMRTSSRGSLLVVESVGRLSELVPCGADCFDVHTLAEGLEGPTAVTERAGMAWVIEARLRERRDPTLAQDPDRVFTARGYRLPPLRP